VWQELYRELGDQGFVPIAVALDQCADDPRPYIEKAAATHPSLIDTEHVVAHRYGMINVPTIVWIDEEGIIVRIDEGTYARTHQFGEGEQAITFGTDVYSPALKDWVAKGADSTYVQSATTVTGNIREHSVAQLKADAAFRLANLFRGHGEKDKAEQYWDMAQSLNPDSINFIRQNLTLTEEGSGGETFMKLMGEYVSQGKDFYRPLDIATS